MNACSMKLTVLLLNKFLFSSLSPFLKYPITLRQQNLGDSLLSILVINYQQGMAPPPLYALSLKLFLSQALFRVPLSNPQSISNL